MVKNKKIIVVKIKNIFTVGRVLWKWFHWTNDRFNAFEIIP